jgi:hypothetical protein
MPVGATSPQPHAVAPAAHDRTRVPTRTASAPLPPPGTPLAGIYDELKARAASGDAAAASRLYHDVRHCRTARAMLRSLPHIASRELDVDTSKMDANALKSRERMLAMMQERIGKAESEAQMCANLGDEQLRLAPVAFDAARLGDTAASDCYISGLPLWTGGVLDHPEWLAEYKDNALAIADNAVAQGDWNMVDQLQRAYSQEFHFGPLAELTGANPAWSYRYLRLRRLGTSDGSEATQLDQQLAAAAQGLSADDVAAGDAWAQDTYSRYFGASAPTSSHHGGMVCEDE